MAFDFMASALQQKAQAGYLRERQCVEYEKDGVISVGGQHYLNFASNDYLAMRQHQGVLQTWVEGLAQFGGGSGASPLVTGYTQAHRALEEYLAEKLNREAVLLFNSGFAANQALCQALFAASSGSNSLILADKFMHASFIDGAMGSAATLKRFKHNDIPHLKTLIADSYHQDCLVASEGIFSMDGDSAPVSDLVALCEQHSAWLMLDDAHGFGVLGKNGMGTCEQYDLSVDQVPVLMATFGKAVGTAGAFIAGSRELVEYLVNFARHYIFSTAMPAAQALATLYSLTEIEKPERRLALQKNIAIFRDLATDAGLSLTESTSAIQPVILGCPKDALAVSEGLRQRGIWVPAIRHPTVPKNSDRLRITLNSEHSQNDIQALVDALQLTMRDAIPCN
ncbi:8-amino-7-oxononanoate synthase [Alteromonas pelagimontana]|uniref:8-amino-7-oxononanoate synthase n=1 Tax=Alteromonas pelagimontana TaxID=1858656 RepID=A0A6M4MAZ6_9ALTE|nr:8-amino-7-oxononanoate synthase [Alteromonas pelagimontana]QJR79800.1 8-amino-7-oxononanoate synthase [Alteromonas pelagimontana]